MGLLDIFRAGKAVMHVAKSVTNQRQWAQEVRALPMPDMIGRCLRAMHPEHAGWKGVPRPPRANAAAMAAAKRLPADLAEFYGYCDGFESTGDFPARVLPLGELTLGAAHGQPPSKRIAAFWAEHGNDSGREGWMTVLPPDDLLAVMSNEAESFVRPSAFDMALPIVPLEDGGFTVVLLAAAGERLPRGAVLDYENGSATRYEDFRHWLATRASLFESLRAMGERG